MGGKGKGNDCYAGVASCVAALVSGNSGDSGDSFGVGFLDKNDIEDLNETVAQKDKRCLVFPGTVLAYSSSDDALG